MTSRRCCLAPYGQLQHEREMRDEKVFRVRDPDFDARIRDSFSRQPFMRHIEVEIDEPAPGRCVVRVPLRTELTQQHGFFHGGVIASLADNVGAYAAFTLIDAGQSMLTVEFKVNFLSPGIGEKLHAVGEVIREPRWDWPSVIVLEPSAARIQRKLSHASGWRSTVN
jgi:uncharacterized protein (TIGR00369 family)